LREGYVGTGLDKGGKRDDLGGVVGVVREREERGTDGKRGDLGSVFVQGG